jgi:Ni/Fe-hydrogenase b-type cytochrome subunit
VSGRAAKREDIRVELGTLFPAGGEERRDLLLAAALGAKAGTHDPVDLALLSEAARKEDLRHYQQLAFTPPDPDFHCSIARLRHLDTGEVETIARGSLDAILYLCRASEADRHRAGLQGGMRQLHGFRPLAVARAPGAEEAGREKWEFLGYIPVRATRLRPRRREEPQAFRYVPVWDWQLRVLHWLAVVAILVLCLSGWLIGSGRLAWSGQAGDPYFVGYLRLVHFSAGWVLVACAILRIAGLFLGSSKYQRWPALFPVRPRDLRNLLLVMRNYLFCIFEHGPHYIGHNPLQQVAYTGIYLMGLIAIATGFALYALYDPEHWLLRHLLWLDDLLGVQNVRLIHLLMMWVFLAFIPIHFYLAIRADTVEREGAISSIISGGRWCRKGTKFEDD